MCSLFTQADFCFMPAVTQKRNETFVITDNETRYVLLSLPPCSSYLTPGTNLMNKT